MVRERDPSAKLYQQLVPTEELQPGPDGPFIGGIAVQPEDALRGRCGSWSRRLKEVGRVACGGSGRRAGDLSACAASFGPSPIGA